MNGAAKRALATVAVTAMLAFAGCSGDGEETIGAPPIAIGYWISQADRYCSDGSQEAAALRVPSSAKQYVADSQARAEILAVVRDAIVTLGQPDEVDPTALASYLEELNADIEVMTTAAGAASEGSPFSPLDLSAAEAAAALGLARCEGFAVQLADSGASG